MSRSLIHRHFRRDLVHSAQFKSEVQPQTDTSECACRRIYCVWIRKMKVKEIVRVYFFSRHPDIQTSRHWSNSYQCCGQIMVLLTVLQSLKLFSEYEGTFSFLHCIENLYSHLWFSAESPTRNLFEPNFKGFWWNVLQMFVIYLQNDKT
jgi:hypothetical protein